MWQGNTAWETIAFYTLAGGIVGAALAAVFGLIDFLSVKDSKVFRVGLMHAGFNVVALIIFIIDFYLRTTGGSQTVGANSKIPFVLSLIGVAFLTVSGWLGGELAYRYGVGVDLHTDSKAEQS